MRSKKAIQQRNRSAEQHLVSKLPFHVLSLVTSHLGARDRGALALTHPVFAEYFRATRERCVARVADRQQLKQLSRDLQKQQALEDLTVIFLFDKPSLSDLSFLPTLTASVSLQFRGEHPARRSFAWLATSQFSLLERLTLAGESRKNRRLNLDGKLSILSNLPALSELKLVNLHSDRGLEKLTQLRSLHIVYPNHDDDAPNTPFCMSCLTVHPNCWFHYLLEALRRDSVNIGTYICSLPLLKNLTLDFNAQCDEMSYSALKNHFLYQDVGPFPALETITMLNTTNFDEEYYTVPEELDACFRFSAYSLWDGSLFCFSLARYNHGSSNGFPSLQHWKLQTDDILRDCPSFQSSNLPNLKRTFITDEQGKCFFTFSRHGAKPLTSASFEE